MSRLAELKQERRDLKQKARALVDAVEENDVSDLDGIESVDEADRLADEVIGDLEGLDTEIDRVEEKRDKLAGIGGTDEDTADEPENEPRAGRRAFEDVNVHDAKIGGDSENDPEAVQKRAFRKWLAFGPEALEGSEQRFVKSSRRREAWHDPAGERHGRMATEFRSTALQVTSSGAAGGDLVPRDFMNELFRDIEDIGNMRDVANTIRTDNGRTMDVPLKRDATAQGEFVAEGSTIASTTSIQYGQETLQANMVRSGPVKVSFELSDDSAFNMEQEVRQELALRISNREETEFVSGTTARTTPVGINTMSTGAVSVVGGTTSITREDLYELKYSALKPGWRQQNPRWLMSNEAWFDILNLEDADGRPLVQPGLQQETEPNLLGDPVVVNEFMDVGATSGDKPIFYGSFQNAYTIRDVNQLRLIRFSEKYANEGAIGFQGFMRVDGVPIFGTTQAARKPARAVVITT